MITESAKKANRQNIKRRIHNRKQKGALKKIIKDFKKSELTLEGTGNALKGVADCLPIANYLVNGTPEETNATKLKWAEKDQKLKTLEQITESEAKHSGVDPDTNQDTAVRRIGDTTATLGTKWAAGSLFNAGSGANNGGGFFLDNGNGGSSGFGGGNGGGGLGGN